MSIWNVDIGLELVSLTAAMESHPLFCAFSPDGNKLAVTESNGNVMVWNVAAGCQWFMIFQGHKGKVTSCSWSADCRKFSTCGTDSVMAIWDAESGAPLFKFNVKAGPLTSCSVSPTGAYVAGGSTTGTLSVCNILTANRNTPEPSFLYHWLATHEIRQSTFLYMRLCAIYPYLANVQDAQGWSVINHALSRGGGGSGGAWPACMRTAVAANTQTAAWSSVCASGPAAGRRSPCVPVCAAMPPPAAALPANPCTPHCPTHLTYNVSEFHTCTHTPTPTPCLQPTHPAVHTQAMPRCRR